MATPLTHGFVGLASTATVFGFRAPWRVWVLAVLCATIPDADIAAFRFGIPYSSIYGHRGLLHGLPVAALVGLLAAAAALPRRGKLARRLLALWAFFLAVAATHGLLDSMTNGGLGVAFFAPFSGERFFMPFRPLVVSPIPISRLFADGALTPRAKALIRSELTWVWTPAILLLILAGTIRQVRSVLRAPPSKPAKPPPLRC